MLTISMNPPPAKRFEAVTRDKKNRPKRDERELYNSKGQPVTSQGERRPGYNFMYDKDHLLRRPDEKGGWVLDSERDFKRYYQSPEHYRACREQLAKVREVVTGKRKRIKLSDEQVETMKDRAEWRTSKSSAQWKAYEHQSLVSGVD